MRRFNKREAIMQQSILGFFQRIANPALDIIANTSSLLGESGFIIAIAAAILWCVNKRKGFAICSTLLTSLVAMNVLKAIVQAPRPFHVLPEIEGKRLSTATGYSFPSGHTTTAASFYSSCAFAANHRAISIACALAILLVGLSRMYLGVHWPVDVAGGLLLGVTISIATFSAFERLYDNDTAVIRYSLIVGGLSTVAGLSIAAVLSMEAGNPVALSDLMKTLALAGGGYLGFALERRFVRYTVEGTIGRRIARYVVGIVILMMIMLAKSFLPDLATFGFLRYFLSGLWAIGLYPLIGSKIKIKGVALFPSQQTVSQR